MNMDDNELRVAIAEACGWTRFPWKEGVREPEGMKDSWVAPGYNKMANMDEYITMIEHTGKLPDFLNSLDAMHQAELIFHRDHLLAEQYAYELERVVGRTKHSGTGMAFQLLNATARQRALAFVQTITQP